MGLDDLLRKWFPPPTVPETVSADDLRQAADLQAMAPSVQQVSRQLTAGSVGTTALAAQSVTMAKLARGTNGQLIIATTAADPAYVTVNGDMTIDQTGNAQIAAGVIVNADVNAAAAIAYSKLNLAASVARTDLAAGVRTTKVRTRYPAYGTAIGANLTVNTTYYLPVIGGGAAAPQATETAAEHAEPEASTVRSVTLDIIANTATGAGTLTLRKNGGDTAMTVSVPAGQTGTFTLAGGPLAFSANDRFALKFVTGTGGTTVTIRGASFETDN